MFVYNFNKLPLKPNNSTRSVIVNKDPEIEKVIENRKISIKEKPLERLKSGQTKSLKKMFS